mmetsp:Transcript_55660/g.134917  ORF Transcript_55660/g.134917 Transcript_55660/m.134917 type:complete len:462 (-) Transcript_55660:7-1392(-)
MSDNDRKVSKFFRPQKPLIKDDKKKDDEGLCTVAAAGDAISRKAEAVTESVAFCGGGVVGVLDEEDSKTNQDDQDSDKAPMTNDRIENKATLGDTVIVDLTKTNSEMTTTVAPPTTATKDPVSLRDRESTDLLSSSSPTLPSSSPSRLSSPQPAETTQKRRRNPFEMFAHPESRSSNTATPTSNSMSSSFVRQWHGIGDRTNSSSWNKHTNKKKKQKTSTVLANNEPNNKTKDCNSKDFARMKDESVEEQKRITKKWLSLADDPPPEILSIVDFDNIDDKSVSTEAAAVAAKVNDFIEMRRFQVLVAARLHARCQEPSVVKAMGRLRTYFEEDKCKPHSNAAGVFDDNDVSSRTSFDCQNETTVNIATDKKKATITLDNIASADPDELARECLTNLQYYNCKAEHIVKAAQEVQKQHRGIVPEDEHSLLRLTGIGKVFADLLAFVNTKEKHIQFMLESLKS